jgi:hypothetical protein
MESELTFIQLIQDGVRSAGFTGVLGATGILTLVHFRNVHLSGRTREVIKEFLYSLPNSQLPTQIKLEHAESLHRQCKWLYIRYFLMNIAFFFICLGWVFFIWSILFQLAYSNQDRITYELINSKQLELSKILKTPDHLTKSQQAEVESELDSLKKRLF